MNEQVAMGIPLHRIPDIRKLYGQDALGDSAIDFDTGKFKNKKGGGHAIGSDHPRVRVCVCVVWRRVTRTTTPR